MASPHTRGWTPNTRVRYLDATGFPAHAGMDPTASSGAGLITGLPRTRGDGPRAVRRNLRRHVASPHTRGWTLTCLSPDRASRGFPAHAGMDPVTPTCRDSIRRLPRTRGDGPAERLANGATNVASPHTRGWTARTGARCRRPRGFPAHAGMDPRQWLAPGPGGRLPRTRGDGPEQVVSLGRTIGASPHTRGWTRAPSTGWADLSGFPAHAGMDPLGRSTTTGTTGLPRTRGDGPVGVVRGPERRRASPHTRGWTREQDGSG